MKLIFRSNIGWVDNTPQYGDNILARYLEVFRNLLQPVPDFDGLMGERA